MQDAPSISPYPDKEKPKLDLLEKLFREWNEHFRNNASTLKKHVPDDLVFDGFYPYYFSQKMRILFVGREGRYLKGGNYIDCILEAYTDYKMIGSQHLNCNKFHSASRQKSATSIMKKSLFLSLTSSSQ